MQRLPEPVFPRRCSTSEVLSSRRIDASTAGVGLPARVILVARLFPPAAGAEEQRLQDIARALARRAVDVLVVTTTACDEASLSSPDSRAGAAAQSRESDVSVARHHAQAWLAPRLERLAGFARLTIPADGRLSSIVAGPWSAGMLRDACAPAEMILTTDEPGAHLLYAVVAARLGKRRLALLQGRRPGPNLLARQATAYLGDAVAGERARQLGVEFMPCEGGPDDVAEAVLTLVRPTNERER